MSNPPEELRAKMVQIGGRFLERVSKEILQLRGMIDAAAGGDLTIVREIETLAHRMHGSGAMLQFNEIADRAGELERLAASFVASGSMDQPRMLDLYRQLQAAIDKACAARADSARL